MVSRMLRDDQSAALDALRQAVSEKKWRICMQAPTGWGKTMLTCALVNGARAKNKRVLFTVPTIALVNQTVEMFAAQGIHDVGVIQAQNPMYELGAADPSRERADVDEARGAKG